MRIINGKLALITGAALGIGRALALELARQGANLLLVDVNEARLAETAEAARRHGAHVETCVADLACSQQVHRVATWVRGTRGELDILINNAGVAYYGTSHEMTEQQWRKVLAVNLMAPMQLTHELLPCLFAPAEAHVLNMCSIAGLVGVTRLAAYNTTKFALVGFSESLRAEYGPRGLGVTAFCPGLVRTGIFESAMTSGGKRAPRFPSWITVPAEKVARQAVRAIRKNQGPIVVPGAARLVWWLERLTPRILDRMQQFRRIRREPATPKSTPAAASDKRPRRAA